VSNDLTGEKTGKGSLASNEPLPVNGKTQADEGQPTEERETLYAGRGSLRVIAGVFFFITVLMMRRQHYARFIAYYADVGILCSAICFLGPLGVLRVLSTGSFGKACKYGLPLGAIFPAIWALSFVSGHTALPGFNAFASSGAVVKFIATVGLVGYGPIIEELLFRGYCYSRLKTRYGLLWATLVSNLAFTIVHPLASIGMFTRIFVRGLVCTWAYQKSGTIWGNIIAHAMINVPGIFFIWLV
jgi:membrane protease YdiL (CAAX protease family)